MEAVGSEMKLMRCLRTWGPTKTQRSWISLRKPARRKWGPKAWRRARERGLLLERTLLLLVRAYARAKARVMTAVVSLTGRVGRSAGLREVPGGRLLVDTSRGRMREKVRVENREDIGEGAGWARWDWEGGEAESLEDSTSPSPNS
jgi:hypothetical protein